MKLPGVATSGASATRGSPSRTASGWSAASSSGSRAAPSGPLQARLGEDLRSLVEGTATAVSGSSTPGRPAARSQPSRRACAERRPPRRGSGSSSASRPSGPARSGSRPRTTRPRWVLGREAAVAPAARALVGPAIRAAVGLAGGRPRPLARGRRRRVMARDGAGRSVLEDGGPEALVAAVLGGVGAGYRLIEARLADAGRGRSAASSSRAAGRGRCRPGRGPAPTSLLEPVPGGAGDPDIVPGPGPVRAAGAHRPRGRSRAAEAARTVDRDGGRDPPARAASRPATSGCWARSWSGWTGPASCAGSSTLEPAPGAISARIASATALRRRTGGRPAGGRPRGGRPAERAMRPAAAPGARPRTGPTAAASVRPAPRRASRSSRRGSPRPGSPRPTRSTGSSRWSATRSSRPTNGRLARDRARALVARRPGGPRGRRHPARGPRGVGGLQPAVDGRPALGDGLLRADRHPVHRPRPAGRGPGAGLPRELPRHGEHAGPAGHRRRTCCGAASEHTELLAELADAGHRLGMRIWLARREQTRRIGGGLLGDRLDGREQRAYLGADQPRRRGARRRRLHLVHPRQGRAACSRSSGRPCSASRCSAGTHRIPPDESLVRFLVIAPERTELVRYKLERSPLLRDRARGRAAGTSSSRTTCGRSSPREPPDLADMEPLPRARPGRSSAAATRCRSSAADPAGVSQRQGDRRAAVPCRPQWPAAAPDSRRHQEDHSAVASTDPPRRRRPGRPLLGGRARARADHRDRLRRPALRGPPPRPGPGGPRRGPLADGADRRGGDRRSRSTASRSRTGSPGTCCGSSPSSTSRRTSSALDQLRVVDQMGGPQQLLPQLTQFQPADTPERLEAFVARLQAYPAYMAANAELLRDGMASGLTAPRIVTERTIAQIERMLAVADRPGDRPVDGPGGVRGGSRADPRDRARRRLPGGPGLPRRAPRRVPRGEPRGARASGRRPTAKRSTGPRSGAGRRWSSTREEVHRIGLEELESIEAERREIARGGRLRRRHGRLPGGARGGSRQHAADARTSWSAAPTRTSSGRWPLAPRYFGRLPAVGLRGPRRRGVQGARRARSPTTSRRRPTARARDLLRQRATTCRAASTRSSPRRRITRRCPGHHFQIALEMENPDLNTFRRLGARMVGGAYVEGWGLYTRAAGRRDGPLPQRGRAVRDARRAGLARRPPRRRHRAPCPALAAPAVDRHARSAPGCPRPTPSIETDRYICWPGQALTYKIGQREIERLRARDRGARRRGFDLRAFHDAVLGHGSMPLATLARELPNWVATPADRAPRRRGLVDPPLRRPGRRGPDGARLVRPGRARRPDRRPATGCVVEHVGKALGQALCPVAHVVVSGNRVVMADGTEFGWGRATCSTSAGTTASWSATSRTSRCTSSARPSTAGGWSRSRSRARRASGAAPTPALARGPRGRARGGPCRPRSTGAARAGWGSAGWPRSAAAGGPRRVAAGGRARRRRPAAGADAQPRVAERVGHPAAHRLAERDREPRGRVDRAAPAVREAQALQLREGAEELRLELLERGRPPVELRADPAARSSGWRRSRPTGSGRRR